MDTSNIQKKEATRSNDTSSSVNVDNEDPENVGLLASTRNEFDNQNNNNSNEENENNDDFEDEHDTQNISQTTTTTTTTMNNSIQNMNLILHKTLLPDDKIDIYGIKFVQGVYTIKFIKFLLFTFIAISLVHKLIQWLDWERDEDFTLHQMMIYEGNLIVLDVLFFYTVGRMHEQKGVDHLAWIIVASIGSIYTSILANFEFLQHSVSLFEMYCKWPWQLWVFVGFVIPLCSIVVAWHVQYAISHKILLMKLLEVVFCFCVFLLPIMGDPFFHFHHWFAGWLLGMHCNYNVWWSRAAMAWCWGQYINGIAVFGRDPMLTCGYAFFVSVDQRCSFVKCYLDAYNAKHNNITDTTNNNEKPPDLDPPKWYNCSATGDRP